MNAYPLGLLVASFLSPLIIFGQPDGPPPGFGREGPGGPGRGVGPVMQETKLVAQFDQDGDKRLNEEERKAAREFHLANRGAGRGNFGKGGRGGVAFPGGRGGRGQSEPAQPGEKLTEPDVKRFTDEPLFRKRRWLLDAYERL